MKTLLALLVFLSPVVLAQGIKSENGWEFNNDPSMLVDSTKTYSIVKDSYQVFSNYGRISEGRNFVQFNWNKHLSAQTIPDTIAIDVYFNSPDTSLKGVWIGLGIEDSSHYFYALKWLFLDATFWYPRYWDMLETKKIFKKFDRIFLMFFLVSSRDSAYVGGDFKVDNLRGIDDTLGIVMYDAFDGTTKVPEQKQIPSGFVLCQNYPNPFNPSTTIRFSVFQKEQVSLVVFNSLGQEIETLVKEEKERGNYEVNFNASNLPSGFYFYRLQTGALVETRKMVLLK